MSKKTAQEYLIGIISIIFVSIMPVSVIIFQPIEAFG
jgi:hypothetical protein